MRIIVCLLFCLVLVSCTSTVPQDVVETESIVDPRDTLPWNKPGYFGSLNPDGASIDYEKGELIAIYRQIIPTNLDNATRELNATLEYYLNKAGLALTALRLFDLDNNGVGDAVYPIAARVPAVTVGTNPVCGQLIARFVFDANVLTLEQAISILLDLNQLVPTDGGFPAGNSLYGISPKGKSALTSMVTSITPAFTSTNWSYSAINAVQGISAAGIKVAVLDTGVNPVGNLHLNLISPANFVQLQAFTHLPLSNAPDDFDDGTTQGHGTAVASLIADDVYGVAPEASIIPVKTCDKSGVCDDITVTRGICYAQSVGADVINISLGTLIASPMVRQAIREVVARGTTVVAAAGNTNIFATPRKNKPDYPAVWASGINGLMSIGAIDQNLEYGDFATANRYVELVAPGSDELLEVGNPPVSPKGIESYDAHGNAMFFEGTSFSAPFVAGAAANLYSNLYRNCPRSSTAKISNTSFSPRWIEPTLKNTVTPWSPVSQDPARTLPWPNPTTKFTPGLLNIGQSLSVPIVCP